MTLIFALIISNQLKRENIEISPKETEKSQVECSVVNNNTITPLIEFSGRINSSNKINIISEVNGKTKLSNSRFEVGEKFKKGEVLIRIEDDDIALELKSIKSQFLTLLVQTLPNINMDYPSLGNKFQKYINNYKLEGKISDLPTPNNSKERNFLASRQIFSNYYSIKSLENKLEKFKIKAPFDGVVTKALIDIGSNIIVGQPIGEFINPSNYEINASVSLKEAKLISIGNKVNINSDDLNNQATGTIKRIGQHINELTQSIDVFISIEGNDIKDGMYGYGEIVGNNMQNVFKVERSKILSENTIYMIENNNLKLKSIDIIAFQDDSVIIEGVNEGDCIVDKYRQYFYDGMQIK